MMLNNLILQDLLVGQILGYRRNSQGGEDGADIVVNPVGEGDGTVTYRALDGLEARKKRQGAPARQWFWQGRALVLDDIFHEIRQNAYEKMRLHPFVSVMANWPDFKEILQFAKCPLHLLELLVIFHYFGGREFFGRQVGFKEKFYGESAKLLIENLERGPGWGQNRRQRKRG